MMAGPWEDFAPKAAVEDGPWSDFQPARGRPAAKAPAKGRGSEADPYRVGTRYKVGSPEYQREVSKVPLGSYFEDPQGNLRQRMNPGAGQPIRKRNVERVGKAEREATGAAANLNRGLLIGDEGSALMGTLGNVLMGKVGPTNSNPLSVFNGIGNTFGNELKKQRDYEDDFDKRRPWTAAAVQTTGMAPTLLVPGGAPAQAATRGGAVAGAAGSAALYAGTAGLADRGTWEERTQAGTRNALIAAPIGGALAGLGTRAPKAPKRQTPTLDDLTARKTAAYQAADQAGVRYSPQGYDDMVTAIEGNLTAARVNPMRHPKAASMLDELKGLKGTSPSLTELDQIRQVIRRDVANATDPAEAFMGQRMIRELDDFISKAGGNQVSSGVGSDGAALIAEARDANTRYAKTAEVTEALESAKLRASSTGSGGNVDNAIRQNMRRVLEGGNNWTPDEANALRTIVAGTKTQNVLRQVGKLSPQGNGLMAAGNLTAAATLGPLGAVPGGAGLLSKYFADKATQQNVVKLLDVIANGGPQAAQATQQISTLPGGAAFLANLNRLSRASGAGVAAANQNSPASAAIATQ